MATEDEKGIPEDAKGWKAPDSLDVNAPKGKITFQGFSHKGEHEVVPTEVRKQQLEVSIRILESDESSLIQRIARSKSILGEILQERERELKYPHTALSGEISLSQKEHAQSSIDQETQELENVRRQLREKREQLGQLQN